MEYAILFLTAIGIYNLVGYWRLDYKVKELGNKMPQEKKTSKKAITHLKETKRRSRG